MEKPSCSASAPTASRGHQDPRAHVNPLRTIGDYLIEALRGPGAVPRRDALARAAAGLRDVGIADAERRLASIRTSCPVACCSG